MWNIERDPVLRSTIGIGVNTDQLAVRDPPLFRAAEAGVAQVLEVA